MAILSITIMTIDLDDQSDVPLHAGKCWHIYSTCLRHPSNLLFSLQISSVSVACRLMLALTFATSTFSFDGGSYVRSFPQERNR